MKQLFQITTNFACFGVEVENEIVTKSAPIGKWTLGKNINGVKSVYEKKYKGTVSLIKEI